MSGAEEGEAESNGEFADFEGLVGESTVGDCGGLLLTCWG